MNPEDTKNEPKVQGEGDYDAARRHRRSVEGFVRQNDTEELARAAEPASKAESEELAQAEADGLARKGGSRRAPRRSGPPST
jgi:hypothetical protein